MIKEKYQLMLVVLNVIALICVTILGVILFLHFRPPNNSPSFVNVIKNSGLDLGANTRGASWADYDKDGHLDLLTLGGRNHLYRNMGGAFREVTEEAGLPISAKVNAGVFGDFDNDGCPDLYLAAGYGSQKRDYLFHNNCDGTFTNATVSAGLPKENFFGEGAAWADYDNDGYLDIYVANYGTWERKPEKEEYFSEPNFLYRNNGDGTFTDVTKKAGVTGVTNCTQQQRTIFGKKVIGLPFKESYQPIWFDYNNDGNIDLFIATDAGVSPLYKSNGDGTFREVTKEAGLCRRGTGMGVTVGDYDNDGYFDLYVTNIGANFLWRNNGNGTFSEIAAELEVADPLSIGWGTAFLDYDNDGYLDLYITNGMANHPFIGNVPVEDVGKIKLDRLFGNNGDGTFTEVTEAEGIYGNIAKEASAVADFNNDGFVDIYVGGSSRTSEAPERLYQNKTNGNNWITIQLKGTKSNRDAIGAKITVTVGKKSQIRQVTAGSSYLAQNSLWQTFGLGRVKKVDKIEIIWPGGKKQVVNEVTVNHKLVITEEK